MNVNLIIGGGTKGTINAGIQGDSNIFVTGSEGDWGMREGWALGLGGQLDYLYQYKYEDRKAGGRGRLLAEANFGYVEQFNYFGDGNAFKGFVQQDLTSYDTFVGARITKGDLGIPAVSVEVSQNLRDSSWHFGGAIGFAF